MASSVKPFPVQLHNQSEAPRSYGPVGIRCSVGLAITLEQPRYKSNSEAVTDG